jgi:hypothetical protein
VTETARLTDDALAAIARTLDADHRASPSADTSRLILAELIERRAKDAVIRAALRRLAIGRSGGGTGDESDWAQCLICRSIWRIHESHRADCLLVGSEE